MRRSFAELLQKLCSGEFTARQEAATEIFLHGRIPAGRAIQMWMADAEFASLLGGDPKVTVGVAVRPDTFERIRHANGSPRLAEVPPDQDAQEFELRFPKNVSLDILTTKSPGGDGAIARFLQRFGEGVQQVEFRCKNVDRAAEILKETFGVASIYPATRAGADGTRVNFFLVSSAEREKVLIELYEK